MLKKRTFFEYKEVDKRLTPNELINIFFRILCENNQLNIDNEREDFIKIGSVGNPINLEFKLLEEDSYKKINNVNNIRFISDAMTMIKNYRVIGSGVYQLLEKSYGGITNKFNEHYNAMKEIEYLIAIDGNPKFNVIILPNPATPKSDWSFRPTKFEFYDNKNSFLDYNPKMLTPKLISMSVSAQNKDNILIKLYNAIVKDHKSKNFKIVYPKS